VSHRPRVLVVEDEIDRLGIGADDYMTKARPGTVLSRQLLLAEVWCWADASATRTVDSHVKSLRRKLGADLLRTVRGVGYALEVGHPPEQES
jgi:DNA-binding winged helix-turn-helix (wHTH) protein